MEPPSSIPGQLLGVLNIPKLGPTILEDGVFESISTQRIGWFVVIICDLLVTWCLYKVYEEHNTKLSIWSASFRLIYTVFLVLAVLSLVRIINTNSLNYTILQHHLVMFETTWSWGLIFFGIHLILLGFLNLNSSIISRVIGIYLCIGGFAYTLFHSIIELDILTLNELKTLEAVLITPMATSEIIFALWLIGGSLHVKHHKRTRTEDVA